MHFPSAGRKIKKGALGKWHVILEEEDEKTPRLWK